MTKQRTNIEVKDFTEQGTFEGVLSTYNVVDLGGDLVEPGAFTKTILEHGNTIPLLWQHKSDDPIGSLELVDGPDALHVRGKLVMSDPVAQRAYTLLKARVIKGLSIGYDTVKSVMDGSIRRLKELRLWEGSVVTFPMCTPCGVTAIKALERKDDFNGELAEEQLQMAGYQMESALWNALSSALWSAEIGRDEKLTAADTIIDQFRTAYLDYLPNYLDYLASQPRGLELMSRQIRERKEGRSISAANKEKLKTAHKHAAKIAALAGDMREILDPLVSDEAGDDPAVDTSTSKARAGSKSEPDTLHSAAKTLISMRSLLRTA